MKKIPLGTKVCTMSYRANILEKLNDDVLQYIIQFIRKDSISIFSEVNRKCYELVQHRLKYFPKKFTIYTSLDMFEWAIEHEYLESLSHDFRIRKYIVQAIKYSNDTSILEYIKNNFDINKKQYSGNLYLLAFKHDKPMIIEWLQDNYFNYDVIFNNSNHNFILFLMRNKKFITSKEDFYDVIKKDDVKKVSWILNSIHYLRDYVSIFSAETNSEKVFKWSVYNNYHFNWIEIIIDNIVENDNKFLLDWFVKQNDVKEYLETCDKN